MERDETHGLGYFRVDDDPNVSVLLATMDATAEWEATRDLRTWERQQLGIHGDQRVLDVGCGPGDAVLTLTDDLAAGGEVVGVDASKEMLAVARSRARAVGSRVRFEVGDALALDEPDESFDVVRSERTLQWLRDPDAAVAEMARVVRPGGRVSLIDTDWSTFDVDVGDGALSRRVRDALRTERHRPSNVGRRLRDLAEAAGLELIAATDATQTWSAWNPERSPAPHGCFSMSSLADDLVDAGQLEMGEQEQFVATVHRAAREDRFRMVLTMFAIVAAAPASTA